MEVVLHTCMCAILRVNGCLLTFMAEAAMCRVLCCNLHKSFDTPLASLLAPPLLSSMAQLLSQSTCYRVRPFQAGQARPVATRSRVLVREPCTTRVISASVRDEVSAPQLLASQETNSSTLWFRAAANTVFHPSTVAAAAIIGLALLADPASAADSTSALDATTSVSSVPLMDLSEQPFWSNISRYLKYFVTVMLGTGYVMTRPFQGLLKNPITAVLGVGGLVAFVFLIKYTVELMTGVEVYQYDPDTFRIVTDQTVADY